MSLQPKAGTDDGAGGEEVERIDPDEFVARVIAQIPDLKRHLIRNYGWYANAARAKRQRDVATEGGFPRRDRSRKNPTTRSARPHQSAGQT